MEKKELTYSSLIGEYSSWKSDYAHFNIQGKSFEQYILDKYVVDKSRINLGYLDLEAAYQNFIYYLQS